MSILMYDNVLNIDEYSYQQTRIFFIRLFIQLVCMTKGSCCRYDLNLISVGQSSGELRGKGRYGVFAG